MLSSLRKKLGGLKHLSKYIPTKSKLILANGLILSKILYLLPIYGGTDKKYMTKIQVVINDTIRFVTDMNRCTSTRTLMESVGWLDIHELMIVHTLLMTWIIIRLKTPSYLSEKINVGDDEKISTSEPRLQNTENGLRRRSIVLWNSLNLELRQEKLYPRFKKRLKIWIMKQRPPI